MCKKKFQSLQAHLKTSIEESKQNYESRLSNKLLDSKISLKSYWSILKIFLNNKKMPCISNLLHNGKCSLLNKNSKLPSVRTKKRVSHFQHVSHFQRVSHFHLKNN